MQQAEKGEKIGEVVKTLERYENSHNSNDVDAKIKIPDVDVELNQLVVVEVHKVNASGSEKVDGCEAKVYENEKTITLKTRVIEENELLPGHKLKFALFEKDTTETEPSDFVDEASVIDRASAVPSVSGSGGIESRLASIPVYEWLGDSKKLLKFRNVRNNKEACASVSRNQREYEFTFPVDVRQKIDVQEKDLIEIINPAAESKEGGQIDQQQLKEMHSMISEMYQSYLNNKNA